jgi:hypothetical protein
VRAGGHPREHRLAAAVDRRPRARDVGHRVPQHQQVRGELLVLEHEAVALGDVADDLRLAVEARQLQADRPAGGARRARQALAALGGLEHVAVGQLAIGRPVDGVDEHHQQPLGAHRPVVVDPHDRKQPHDRVAAGDGLARLGGGRARGAARLRGDPVAKRHRVILPCAARRVQPCTIMGTAMEIDVASEIEIGVPREQVARFAADPGNATLWRQIFEEAEPEHVGSPQVGWRVIFVSKVLAGKVPYTYQVVEHVPGERLVMRTEDGPFPVQTTYAWEDAGDGATRMTLQTSGEPKKHTTKLAVRLMTKAWRKADAKDLAALKAVLERG